MYYLLFSVDILFSWSFSLFKTVTDRTPFQPRLIFKPKCAVLESIYLKDITLRPTV